MRAGSEFDAWSWWRESNPQPLAYKASALPLSYTSALISGIDVVTRMSAPVYKRTIIVGLGEDFKARMRGIFLKNLPRFFHPDAVSY